MKLKITKWLAFLPLLAFVACTSGDQAREVKSYTIQQFMGNVNQFGGRFSADETKLLISSDVTGVYNAYSMPAEGGEMTALTQSDSTSVYASSFFPKDDRIIYQSDGNGDEVYHIFMRDLDGSVTDLTPWEGARSTFYGWTFDETAFYFGSNKRDNRFMDVYTMDIETFEPTMIFQNDEGLSLGSISRDKKYMAFTKPITTDNDEMYLLNTETNEMKHISEHEGNASFSPEGFSHDSKELFYTTNLDNEFSYLVKYDIESGETEKMLEFDWDIWYSYLSYNGKYRVTGINEDAKTVIKVTDLEKGEDIKFPADIKGDIKGVRLAKSEEKMTFWVGSSKSPSDLYIFDFKTGEAKRLTSALNEEIDENDLVDGEVIRYASFDGTQIPAVLYKPHQASKKNPAPALVWVHGGPGGQSRLSYFPLIQYLVNHGYVVLAVNNRGSSGYGKTFYAMDNRNHGEGDLQDCIIAKDYLATTGYVDTANIGIIGGSYGGYMTMAALTMAPTEFKTGVNIFGVTNWLRTLKSIPPWWESFRQALYEEMGDPETDSVRLHRISPLFHADQIERPFMVLQGANDPRVLQVESDEIVEAARANGVEVEYVLFPDEGHGFSKKDNQLVAYEKILKFLDAQLKPLPEAVPIAEN